MNKSEFISKWLPSPLRNGGMFQSDLNELIEKYTHCQSCEKPLSRDCPKCKRLWES